MTLPNDALRELVSQYTRLKQENQELRAEIARLRQALRSLVRLQSKIESITPQSNPYDVVHLILSAALEAVNSRDGSLMLLDEETQELVFVLVLGAAQKTLTNYRLPPGEGIASWVVASRTPKLVLDVRSEPLFSPLVDKMTGFMTLSLICVPLVYGDRTLGAIEVVNTITGDPFKQEDLELLQLVALLATLAILRAEG